MSPPWLKAESLAARWKSFVELCGGVWLFRNHRRLRLLYHFALSRLSGWVCVVCGWIFSPPSC